MIMLIDTHCHINMLVKKEFDVPLIPEHLTFAYLIFEEAKQKKVTQIVNVGTSLIESKNCALLAEKINGLFATVGIHPNDCTAAWKSDLHDIQKLVEHKEQYNIVGIGECGIDLHYPDYNLSRQQDAFRAQIELALEHDLALVVHSRDAAEETLRILFEYEHENLRGTMHCYSYDMAYAQEIVKLNFVFGIGGTLTYPRNNELRTVATTIPLDRIVLETDAPFLPIQSMRGKQNHPQYIANIAQYLAELRNVSFEEIAQVTTHAAQTLFRLPTK
jgi:TatD DNase family protein